MTAAELLTLFINEKNETDSKGNPLLQCGITLSIESAETIKAHGGDNIVDGRIKAKHIHIHYRGDFVILNIAWDSFEDATREALLDALDRYSSLQDKLMNDTGRFPILAYAVGAEGVDEKLLLMNPLIWSQSLNEYGDHILQTVFHNTTVRLSRYVAEGEQHET